MFKTQKKKWTNELRKMFFKKAIAKGRERNLIAIIFCIFHQNEPFLFLLLVALFSFQHK